MTVSILLKSFIHNGKHRFLKKPLVVQVQHDDDKFILSNDDLSLFAVGYSIEAAYNELSHDLGTLWKEYVEADPSTLTGDALEFREKLIAMTKE